MKKMKYIYSGVLVSALMISGCSDSFMDLKPIALDTELTFYKDFNAVDMTVTAAYANLCARDVDYFYKIPLSGVASDDVEAGGQSISDWPEWQGIDKFSHTILTSEKPTIDLWNYDYKGIRFTNTALAQLPTILEKDKTATQEKVNQRIGECKFLRAFFHFRLLQVFGGIPIADKVLAPDEFYNKRNSIAEVLHFIEKDLEDAIGSGLLKKSAQSADNVGRVTIGAAHALLEKVYLYESSYAENYASDERFAGCTKKYDKALSEAQSVINDGSYDLVGINGERFASWRGEVDGTSDGKIGGYRWIHTVAGDNSKESVWEAENVQDGLGYTRSRGTYCVIYESARYANVADAPSQLGGWGFNLPSRYLIAAFAGQDKDRANALFSTDLFDGDNLTAAWAPVIAQAKKDPRFSTTVGLHGEKFQFLDGSTAKILPMHLTNTYGVASRKMECSTEEYWLPMAGRHQEGPINVKYIRFADVYLMAAEAAIKTGDAATALAYVNKVRERARKSALPESTEPKALTACTMDDIMLERRLELGLEGGRYFDIIRWGKGEQLISGTHTYYGAEIKFVPGREFFPIPNSQVLLSNGNLVQYPAWQ
jgi:hypothetical protein